MRVAGSSMTPVLRHNDLMFTYKRKKINVNKIVVVNVRKLGFIVKRVHSVSRDCVRLKGDNPRLASSVCDADIPLTLIAGTVFLSIRTKTISFYGHDIIVSIKFFLV